MWWINAVCCFGFIIAALLRWRSAEFALMIVDAAVAALNLFFWELNAKDSRLHRQ